MSEGPAGELELRVAPPATQRRGSVAARALLLVVLFAALTVVSLALSLLAPLGWIAVIATGQLPWRRQLVSYLGWRANIEGYALLLTERYPATPKGDSESYAFAISLEVTQLRRQRTLLRVALAIPFSLLAIVLAIGGLVVGVVGNIATLVTGTMPVVLQDAVAVNLRSRLRIAAFFFGLQDPLPSGLLGDGVKATDDSDESASAHDDLEIPVGMKIVSSWSPSDDDLAEVTPLALSPWRLPLRDASRVTVMSEIAVGSLAAIMALVIILTSTFTSSTISAQTWSNRYWNTVNAVEASVATGYGPLHGDAPPARVLERACNAVHGTLAATTRVTSYPTHSLEGTYVAALGALTQAVALCRTVVAHPSTSTQGTMMHDFDRGYQELTQFLSEIPAPQLDSVSSFSR